MPTAKAETSQCQCLEFKRFIYSKYCSGYSKESERLNTDAETKNSSVQSRNKSALIKLVIGIVLVLLLALIAFGLWKSYQPKQVELQGRVEAETIHISTKVPSRI